MGKSAFGPGLKAGGPNYVVPLMRFEDKHIENPPAPSPSWGGLGRGAEAGTRRNTHPLTPPHQGEGNGGEITTHLHALRNAIESLHPLSPLSADDRDRLAAAIDDYLVWAEREFSVPHDHFRLVGEDNFRRYLPITNLWIRLHADDDPFSVMARAAAARAANCRVVMSYPPELAGPARDACDLLDALTDSWAAAIEFVEETDPELAAAVRSDRIGRLRYAAPNRVPETIRLAAAESLVYIADAPPLAHGRVELLWYVQEQSLSHAYHRYGNLGRRALEPRAPLP
jgi:RHH-type proline utilization regulon transcriptional repressor/proline dehydrogenase/delta 1-pyrroline-5-carboxylate dehydrogenase